MPDIAVVFDPAQYRGDFSLASGDLAVGDDLQTLVIVSLFTERGAWWGDAYDDVPLGSYLHRLLRAKRTDETLLRARDYARDALAWLVKDDIAREVEVVATYQNKLLCLQVDIRRQDGSAVKFQWAWDALGII